jgi:hypothetical protein
MGGYSSPNRGGEKARGHDVLPWAREEEATTVRIWSLHPKYLDPPGLVALWREGLLAQAVLRGRTRAYARHPQLVRFLEQPSPLGAIAEYLRIVRSEAVARGYRFDGRKISRARAAGRVDVTRGQLQHEWRHLMGKLGARNPRWRAKLEALRRPRPHPLFRVRRGPRAAWEKGGRASPGPAPRARRQAP